MAEQAVRSMVHTDIMWLQFATEETTSTVPVHYFMLKVLQEATLRLPPLAEITDRDMQTISFGTPTYMQKIKSAFNVRLSRVRPKLTLKPPSFVISPLPRKPRCRECLKRRIFQQMNVTL